MAQTKRGTPRERVDARTNWDEGWLSALVTALNLTSPSGLSGLSDAFNLCAENCQRDICVTVYREWVKKITKFTKSTYRRFVACCAATTPPCGTPHCACDAQAAHRISWRASVRGKDHHARVPAAALTRKGFPAHWQTIRRGLFSLQER